MLNPNTPILVGVAQAQHRGQSADDLVEPLEMMLEAAGRAEEDAGVRGVLKRVQSVRVIQGVWSYDNPARYIAEKIGAPGARTTGTLFGGNYVQYVVNHTASSILAGDLDLVLITGAENGNSAARARKAGIKMSLQQAPGEYDLVFGRQQPEHHNNEIAMGIKTPIQIYPMYENAIRYHRGETLDEHMIRVSELWSRFNDVAVNNPHAWIQENMTAEEIRTPSATNRRVSFPYTKLMNANMVVDMGAALIMCSVSKARQLGIPESRWVYPHAGVEGNDHFSASVRDNFHSSPAIRLVGQRVMELANTTIEEISYVDLYSCFPAAVQIAASELGLDEKDQLTVTGGLTFGGGPLNNYVMHAIATMAEQLRVQPGEKGLVTANGGNLYKHAHGIYSAEPPARDFQHDNVQTAIDRLPARDCVAGYQGEATIESWTVMFSGDGPAIGHCACRTPDGSRTWVNTEDPELMRAMTVEEFCGRDVTIGQRGVTPR